MNAWTIAAGLAVLGLWNLFCPRAVMRSAAGSGSSHGEPHPGYVFAVRATGVVFLAAAVGVAVAGWRSDHEAATGERVGQDWGVTLLSRGSVDEQVRSSTGLRIDGPSTSPPLDDDESTVTILRYAVVGEDDDALGGALRPTDAQDGDLVVGVEAGSCAPARLVVDERGDQVRMTVVVTPSDAWREQYQESRDIFAHVGVDPPEPPRCSTSRPSTLDEEPALDLVHVPLDRPLRDRTLVDASTGDDVPRVPRS